jgi:adenylosuccinate synthase
MKAFAVIGAGFGDEGKGLMTDYLAANLSEKTVIVRFNGGAQAGHTVQTPGSQRHVFKHFGSGSFAGCPTFLSEFFICNPILFHEEFTRLNNFNLTPTVYVHKHAIVSTPYDMMINQIVEEVRNNQRHGSCGVGINETVERNLVEEFSLKFHELFDRDLLIARLLHIQQTWVKKRLAIHNIKQVSPAWQTRLDSAGIIEYFLNEVDFFIKKCTLSDYPILTTFTNVIFEGAQGLLLDEVKGFFPHVTRSSTGIKNIIAIAKSCGISEVEVFYMTRAYLTRHGSGPLPFELKQIPYPNIIDATNVPNMHQGALRFAWLNLDLLQQAIFLDLEDARDELVVRPNLVVTCMDQLDDQAFVIKEEEMIKLRKDQFLGFIQNSFAGFTLWSNWGPTRDSMVKGVGLREERSVQTTDYANQGVKKYSHHDKWY